ncbi:hypothetical protein ABLU29_03290 [Lactococcus lactis]|uniref:hypothetical protein n=1 Tax=Lactococcus lactis TaxID=1358 RepID=UPI000C9EE016|nr:hypothetical protein [Lactococcus lactis]AUS69137.1 hypothetical protein LLG50_03305 [Lactococcus lactis subsp. lactis]
MSKNTELIIGLIAGVTIGVLVSPKKVYELKMKTGENYNHFIEENGPISKELILKLIQEKRDSYSKKTNEIVEEVAENVSETNEEMKEETEETSINEAALNSSSSI